MPDPQKDYADAPLAADQLKSVGFTDAPMGAHPEAKIGPDPNANIYPWRKTGQAIVKGAVDALPVLGGAAGAALGGGPEDVPAVALGVGAGRGLRDLVAEKLGLEPETSPAGKAARIALDTAITGAAPTVLNRLKDVVTNPKGTLADLIETVAHPQKQLGEVIDFLRRSPDSLGMGTTRPPLRFPSPEMPATVTAPASTMPAGTPTPGLSPQALTNDLALTARRAGFSLSDEQMTAAQQLVQKGATPQQAVGAVSRLRSSAPVASGGAAGSPASPPPPSPASSAPSPVPQSSPAPAAATGTPPRGLLSLTEAEKSQFDRLKARGMSDIEAGRQIQAMRSLVAQTKGATDAEMRAEMARRARAGQKSLMPVYGTEPP